MATIDDLLRWLHPFDFAVFAHGWAPHGRDYVVVIQDMLGTDPGTHELTFTHCVQADCTTRVRDDVWPRSWTDTFIDYEVWEEAGEPEGYVWGTNWSNAYPGLSVATGSTLAMSWSERLGAVMEEVVLESDRFALRLVFHSIRHRKVDDDTGTIAQVHIPLGP